MGQKKNPKHQEKNKKCVVDLLGYVKCPTALNPTSTLTLRYDATEFRNNRPNAVRPAVADTAAVVPLLASGLAEDVAPILGLLGIGDRRVHPGLHVVLLGLAGLSVLYPLLARGREAAATRRQVVRPEQALPVEAGRWYHLAATSVGRVLRQPLEFLFAPRDKQP